MILFSVIIEVFRTDFGSEIHESRGEELRLKMPRIISKNKKKSIKT